MRTTLTLLFVLISTFLYSQDNSYNGIADSEYVELTNKFVAGFKAQNFDLIKGYILSDSIKTAQNFFNKAIKDGLDDGINWSKVEYKYRVVYNNISTGNNPTKYDIAMVDRIIAERREESEYSLTIWAICSHNSRLIELEIGTFYEVGDRMLSDGEFYYYDEPTE